MGKILVIDDHTEIRELFAEVLADHGHQVVTAADGSLGLALYARHRPVLVITDLKLPGITGLEIIERLRLEPDVKIIAISGSGSQDLDTARRLGAAKTFQKPFTIDDLVRVVEALLGEGLGTCGT